MTSLNADPAARARTAMDLADAQVEAESAEKILASVKSAYEAAKFQPVKAPQDAYVWSVNAEPGDFVRAGAPVATWVDCSIMLVDVPVSDVELALLRTDAPARIVIEGDRKVRDGKVYLTRGAAATIGADDLAAIAKGRHAGIGQVLVQFEPSAADIWECRSVPQLCRFSGHRHRRHAARPLEAVSAPCQAIRKSLRSNWRNSVRSVSPSSPISACLRSRFRSAFSEGHLPSRRKRSALSSGCRSRFSPTR
jgi:hypothetical protein